MNLQEYASYDGLGLAELVKSKQVTPKELVDLALEGIEKINPELNAVWQTLKEHAYKEIEEGLPKGDFEGVPLLLKELIINADGVSINSGSRLAEGVSGLPIDSFLMECFRKAGFVTIGTTSTPEFGFNATTEPVVAGPTHNPWGLGHSSGGSSGGAGVAVASGIVPIAHGSDGGGSIRIPASQCGVVGLKPTRGRVSAGPFYSEPLAGNGIEFALTKTIRDTAALLDIVSEPRPGEYAYAPKLEGFASYKECIETPVRKLKIAYSTETASGFKPTQDVVDALHATVELLRSLGHEVVEDYPVYDREKFLPAITDIWNENNASGVEAFSAMTGRKPSLDFLEATTYDSYLEGKKLTAVQFCTSQATLGLLSRQIGEFFLEYDVLLTPTMSSTAVKHGVLDANKEVSASEFIKQMLGEVAPYTAIFNMTGQPAISLPLQQSPNGFPIGMQFVGKFGDEATLLQLGKQLEEAAPWKDRIPTVHVSIVQNQPTV